MSSQATDKASKRAQQTQQDAQAQLRSDLSPYTTAGTNALAPQQALLGLNGQPAADDAMANFQASPGYQYQLGQGVRAAENSAAAQGMLHSGATMKAIQDRGNALAQADFATYYNRLAGLTTMGQNSAAGVGAAGATSAAGVAQTQASAGSTEASIYGNAASGLGGLANQGLSNYQYGQRTNALAPSNSIYGSGAGVSAGNSFTPAQTYAADSALTSQGIW